MLKTFSYLRNSLRLKTLLPSDSGEGGITGLSYTVHCSFSLFSPADHSILVKEPSHFVYFMAPHIGLGTWKLKLSSSESSVCAAVTVLTFGSSTRAHAWYDPPSPSKKTPLLTIEWVKPQRVIWCLCCYFFLHQTNFCVTYLLYFRLDIPFHSQKGAELKEELTNTAGVDQGVSSRGRVFF